MATYQFMPRRALRAARILANNPDDLPQVFTIIESLSGNLLERLARRFAKSAHGRRLMAERPDIVDVLADRQALARLPAGSLGRAYLDFVESENISADGIRAAANAGMTMHRELPPDLDWVHRRMRDTHDLWHAAVGYKGDILGETALLGFIFVQTWNPAIALIIGVGLVKTRHLPGAREIILDGLRRGRRAAWLPDQPWEDMLALPVEEVRRRLGLEAAPVYAPLRSATLAMQQAA